MTVENQFPYQSFTANGSQTNFALGFYVDDKYHFEVKKNDLSVSVNNYSYDKTSNTIAFDTPTKQGDKIEIQRKTTADRATNYATYNNTFRPEVLNKDLDKVWLKIQELGVADQLLKAYAEQLHTEQQRYIEDQDQLIRNMVLDLHNYVIQQDNAISASVDNLHSYVDRQDNSLRNHFDSLIYKQGVSLEQLNNYYKHLLKGMADIATQKGWLASLVSDASGDSQQQVNDSLKSSVFYHIDSLEDAQKYLGYIVEYNEKHFKVSSEQSKDIRHPTIQSGNTYLIPHDYTTLSFKTANFTLKGSVPNPENFIKPEVNPSSGWSQQGFVIDNVNHSVFISSITVSSTDISAKVYEYEFINGVMGAIKAQSDLLSMAHADFFAITQKNGERTIWFYKPPVGSNETSPGGDIVGVKWKAGCSDSDIFVTIPFSAFETTYASELNVSNFDDESIIIQGTYNNIVDIDALYEGRVLIKERRQSIWVANGGDIVTPVQQRIAIVDTQACLSGVFLSQTNSCYYSASNRDGSKVTLNPIHKADASERSEVEGLGFYWNPITLQFEPYVSVWEQRTGDVSLYNLASTIQSVPSLARFRYVTNSDTMGQYKSGQRSNLDHPFNIGCHGILIGGNQHPDRHGNDFKKENFIIEQWASGWSGRYGARFLYKNTQMLVDAEEDASLSSGWRFQISGSVKFQILDAGLNIGHRRLKTERQLARVHVTETEKPAFYTNTADSPSEISAPSYLSSSKRVDYGVLSTASIKFGRHDLSTGESTQLMYMNDTVFRPTRSDELDLGATSGRFKKVYANKVDLLTPEGIGAKIDSRGPTSNISYLSQTNGLDFASIGSIKFGGYDSDTNTVTRYVYLNNTVFGSYSDSTINIGTASNKFNNLYLAASPIVSSDERLKQQIRPLAEQEKAAAIAIKNAICIYKFNNAVDIKGDGARWHVGVKAQEIVSIMQAHGLDPFDYGFICFDEWESTEDKEAGSAYAVRYDELSMFILATL